jgi:hypothetical protein
LRIASKHLHHHANAHSAIERHAGQVGDDHLVRGEPDGLRGRCRCRGIADVVQQHDRVDEAL